MNGHQKCPARIVRGAIMAHDVFISYSHKDHKIADGICNYLEKSAIRCWMAPRDIEGGDVWSESITTAISNSKVIVLVFSEFSNASKQVLREVELAINGNLILIPFKLDQVKPTGGMSYYLATTHWIDLLDATTEERYSHLCNRIKSIMETTHLAVNEPPNEMHKPFEKTGFYKKTKTKIFLAVFSSIVVLGLIWGIFYANDASSFSKLINKSDLNNVTTETASNNIGENQNAESVGEIVFNDENFEMMIRRAVGKNVGDPITSTDLESIYELAIAGPYLAFKSALPEWNGDHLSHLEYDTYEYKIDGISTTEKGEIKSFDDLALFENLTTLYIYHNDLVDLKVLNQLVALQNIKIVFTNTSDLSDFNNVNLKSFVSFGNMITNLNFLSHMGNLNNLSINTGFNRNNLSEQDTQTTFTDLSPLLKLSKLTGLHLNGNDLSKVTNIEVLSTLDNLIYASFALSGLESIDFLEPLVNLESLELEGNNITNRDPIGKLINIKYINF